LKTALSVDPPNGIQPGGVTDTVGYRGTSPRAFDHQPDLSVSGGANCQTYVNALLVREILKACAQRAPSGVDRFFRERTAGDIDYAIRVVEGVIACHKRGAGTAHGKRDLVSVSELSRRWFDVEAVDLHPSQTPHAIEDDGSFRIQLSLIADVLELASAAAIIILTRRVAAVFPGRHEACHTGTPPVPALLCVLDFDDIARCGSRYENDTPVRTAGQTVSPWNDAFYS
jgi:hypothetical protein